MKAFIDAHRGAYGIELICRVMQIATAGYRRHAAQQRNPLLRCARAHRDDMFIEHIQRVWQTNMRVDGADKVWRQLHREGIEVARCTVERLMRRLGLRGAMRGKGVRTTVQDANAPCPLKWVNSNSRSARPPWLTGRVPRGRYEGCPMVGDTIPRLLGLRSGMSARLKRFQKRPFISTLRERFMHSFTCTQLRSIPVPAQPTEQHGVIARQLDRLQAQGQLVATVDELAMMGGLSYLAARRQLERLAPRVVRLPGSSSSFLIVPPEHQARGAPPVAAWLDAYLQRRGQPYYLGLLSAAALHGASQQAVQVTQVITDFAIRSIDIGRLHLDFYVKHHVRETPLSPLPGLPAPLAVSTPEATALDLIAFNTRIGGIRRVAEVIAEMQSAFTVVGLRQALAAEQQTALKQRLGYVLEVLGMDRLAAEVRKVLPERCALAVLQTHASMRVSRGEAILPWMVVDNVGL